MKVPLITVLMPVYNAERTVEAAIQSVLAQTEQDFEFRIYDDGSTDKSRGILNRLARKDPRLILREMPHQGYTPLLNLGIQESQSDFLARMDSDDVCFPDRFATQIEFLKNHPEVVAVGSSVELIDHYGDAFSRMTIPTEHDEIDARHLAGGGGVMPHPSVMMRAEAIRCVGGYDPMFEPAEDLHLWLRLAEVGRLANIPRPLLQYRVHPDMISIAQSAKQRSKQRLILEQARKRRGFMDAGCSVLSTTLVPTDESDVNTRRMEIALRNGYLTTARRYAFRRLLQKPLAVSRWRDIAKCLYAELRNSKSDTGGAFAVSDS
jgi:hypothetical protein